MTSDPTGERTTLTVVVDTNGAPVAAIDQAAVQAAGEQLAVLLAFYASDDTWVAKLLAESEEEHGAATHGLITAVALKHLVVELLGPLIEIADAHGHAVRQRLSRAGEQ